MREVLRLSPADRGRYVRVPFEVPAASGDDTSVRVRLEMPEQHAVIDLGLWDPTGWRGYSGGARREVVIAPDAATPGYREGPIPAGQWAVELGIYRVTATVDVSVTVDVSCDGESVRRQETDAARIPAPRDELRGSALGLPAPPGLTWFAGDFHAHSQHSDGTLSLDELAAEAVGNGLDFLAVTDHNTVSHHPHLADVGERQGILLLPGQEVTTDRGHANVFGDVGWIDFHEPSDEWFRLAQDRGAVISINHPLADHCAWQWPTTALPPALEFWHRTWFADADGSGLTDSGMWALWARWRPDATVLGGSDFHSSAQGYPPGAPTTWVAARECTVEAILEGVAAGRTAISRGDVRLRGTDPRREPVLVWTGSELVAHQGRGLALVSPSGSRTIVPDEAVIHAEAVDEQGVWRLETHEGALVALAAVRLP